MITPRHLTKGSRIAIISPATEVKPEYIDGAELYLRRRGYIPVTMPHARGPRSGTYAAAHSGRLSDLHEALFDPSISCIFCARGGYGCCHLLSPASSLCDMPDSEGETHPLLLRPEDVALNPKWLVGFSDISALHALWLTAGVRSLHSSMAKQLTLFPDVEISEEMFQILEGGAAEAESGLILHEIKACGPDAEQAQMRRQLYDAADSRDAVGTLVGGNLAVLNGLASTPYDILSPDRLNGRILFLEDVGEKIYQVERMLTRLWLAGSLEAAAGLIFGQFTDYQPDANFCSMEAMITARMLQWGIKCPVAIGMPIGHIDANRPVVEGSEARLEIFPDGARLSYTV